MQIKLIVINVPVNSLVQLSIIRHVENSGSFRSVTLITCKLDASDSDSA